MLFHKKSLLTSLCQREGNIPCIKGKLRCRFPSLAKRGEGRFYGKFHSFTEGIPAKFAFCTSQKGFTLLELIVVLFLISLVMAVVLPSFAGLGENKLRSEAREMASILRYLNDSSASRKETFKLKFDLNDNTVSWKGPEGEKTRKFEDMTGVSTQSTGTVSKGELTLFFEPVGIRENLEVFISRGDKTLTITLNHLSGRVKIKDAG